MIKLRDARQAAGLTMKELGDKVGVSESAISLYERGKREPSFGLLTAFAECLDVPMSYLLGEGEDVPISRAEPPPEPSTKPSAIHIPVLGSVNAGIPLYAIENIVDWEDIPISMGSSDREYFGLKVKGDSMYPDYHEGDTIIVRRTPDFESGSVCVVYVDGYDATLKQVRRNTDGTITLIPRNPEYAPKTYDPATITICGVVEELRRKI